MTSPAPLPPAVAEELRHLLSGYYLTGQAKRSRRHPDLKMALDELRAWLNDPRAYNSQHKNSWVSMADDVRRAISCRGPVLAGRVSALDQLHALLATTNLGDKPPIRSQALQLLEQAESDLRNPQAAAAAFQDLADAVSSIAATHDQVEALTGVLAAVLRIADRTLSSEAWSLTRVLEDSAFEIGWVRHELDALPGPQGYDRSTAGLSVEDRLLLCSRLLSRVEQPGDHVVWLVYGNAPVGWRIDFGPVTFFEGELLLQILRDDDLTDWKDGGDRPLPIELTANDRSLDTTWPKAVERWCAVRVDLGVGRYSDPVGTARKQADAVVKLAGFQGQGTSWRLWDGARVFIDQKDRTLFPAFRPPEDDDKYEIDRTADNLEELSAHLVPHLPSTDPGLDELLEAAGYFDKDPEQPDPLEVPLSVRVIELLASRCDLVWQQHLKTTFAISWAKDRIVQEIHDAVLSAVWPGLGEKVKPGLPNYLDLQEPVGGERVRFHGDRALAAVPDVLRELPADHLTVRRVRDLHEKTKSTVALQRWIEDLRAEYERLVNRLARCRNALSHGGPINYEVVATVTPFSRAQAKRTTSLGLWATIAGDSVWDAHDKRRRENEAWAAAVPTAGSASAALFPPQQSGAPRP